MDDLPATFMHEFMAGKKPDVVPPAGDADGPPAISIMRPDYVLKMKRVSFGGSRPKNGGARSRTRRSGLVLANCVSVMLFEGWGLYHGNRRRGTEDGWAWRTHPFNPTNSINGAKVEGADALSGTVHSLRNSEVNELPAAYIRKVVDTLNDLDNVLYEVITKHGEKEWNWWVVKTVHDYESTKPKQHPVGNTGHGAARLPTMLASPAEWVLPGRADGFAEDPPAWSEEKVSLLDTDHIWGVGGNAAWVWKSSSGARTRC